MIRVFLDANILLSAAWREGSGIGALWEKDGVHLVTSWYALTEAQRNIALKKPSASLRLTALTSRVEVSTITTKIHAILGLPDKDLPILEAAVSTQCSVLLTGDITHFGHLLGVEIEGVNVLTASMFLATDGIHST